MLARSQVIMLVLGGALICTDSYGNFGYSLIFSSIILALPYFRIGRTLTFAEYALVIFVLFSFVSLPIHHDPISPLNSLILLVVWLTMKSGLKTISTEYVYSTTVVIMFVLFVLGMAYHGLKIFSYQGIFYNPNSLGIYSSMSCVLIISNALTSKKNRLLKSLLILATFILTITTSSRTSILAIILAFSILGLVFLAREHNALAKVFKTKNIFLVLVAVIVLYKPVGDIYTKSIVRKINTKSGQGNMTSGRSEVWIKLYDKFSFSGSGRDYMDGINVDAIKSAHNTYISMLAQNGWIAGIAYLLFWLILLYESMKITRYKMILYRYLPLSAILLFCFLALGEGMNAKSPMFVAFMLIQAARRDVRRFNQNMESHMKTSATNMLSKRNFSF